VLVSFLICGLHGRPWKELAESIQKQIDAAGVACEVLTNVDGGEKSSGRKRNELTFAAKGEYIAFIDDDDTVSSDYVSKIVGAIKTSSPDVVSFWMDVKIRRSEVVRYKARRTERVRERKETWRLGIWPDDRRRGMMAANHLCCWKKDLATQVPWCEKLGYGDDQLWYGPLHAAFAVQSFHEIKSCLYFYECDLLASKNQTQPRIRIAKNYFGSGLRCFLIEGNIAIEDGIQDEAIIKCFSCEDKEVMVDTSVENPFHIVRVM